jgi:ankyrin repeat protein
MLKKDLGQPSPHHSRQTIVCLALLCCTVSIFATDLHNAEKAIRMRDYGLAFSLYQDAALAGDFEAQHQLANLYQFGKGVDQSDEKALLWWKKSALNGHPAAQYNFAIKLMKSNPENAMAMLHDSAQQGYVPAQAYLDRVGAQSVSAVHSANSNIEFWLGLARNNAVDEMSQLKSAGQIIDQTDEVGRTALFAAVESGSSAAIEWLLTQGADPNHRDQYGNSPVFLAIAKDNAALLEILFGAGAKVDQTLPNGDNLLHYCIRYKHYELLPLLLDRGVPINQLNGSSWSPLDMAEYAGDQHLIKTLKASGANRGKAWTGMVSSNHNQMSADKFINANGTFTLTISDLAKVIVSGNVDLAAEIISKRPEMLAELLSDGSTLLGIAVKQSDTDMVTALLNAGANPNQTTATGISSLQIAATGHDFKVLELLLKAGANPLSVDENGLDLMGWAIMQGQASVAFALLDYLLADKRIGREALPIDRYILFSAQANNDAMAGRLLPLADTTVDDELGRNALWYAAHNKNPALIQQLLTTGMTVEPDHQGITPFYKAIELNCLICAQYLLGSSDINEQTLSGTTALMVAALAGNTDLSQWLLEQHADTELRNDQGNTALIYAVQADAIEVVRLLLGAKATISRKNKLGFSAVDIAKKHNSEIYTLLKSTSVLGIF